MKIITLCLTNLFTVRIGACIIDSRRGKSTREKGSGVGFRGCSWKKLIRIIKLFIEDQN